MLYLWCRSKCDLDNFNHDQLNTGMIQVNPRGKKTKFSSSFYTHFRERTDNKYVVQFKVRPTPRRYKSTVRWTRTRFPTLSRYGTRPCLVDVPIMWRKNVKCEKHRNWGSAAAKHFHCFRFQKSSLFQILLIEYEIFV